jgi:hypothetical protein
MRHECASETVRLFVLEGMTDVDSRYLGDTVTVGPRGTVHWATGRNPAFCTCETGSLGTALCLCWNAVTFFF